MPNSYSYKVKATTNPLTAAELYEGRSVCFNDVQSNPNNVGILEKNGNVPTSDLIWAAVINNKKYIFDRNGKINGTGNPVLYGLISSYGDVDPVTDTHTTRGAGTGESTTVSLTSMTPKDYFACEALNALIMRYPNPLSMDDGVITLLAAKSYKIAQAMAQEAYDSRQNDKSSSDQQGTSYVTVDETSLQTNTERILYNLNESVKAQTQSMQNNGVKVSNIDKVKFDGTPTIQISGTPNVNVSNTPNVNISNTPNVNVSNMPSEPIEVEGTVAVSNMPSVPSEPVTVHVDNMPSVPTEPVTVSGTVSVDNFPTNSNSNT